MPFLPDPAGSKLPETPGRGQLGSAILMSGGLDSGILLDALSRDGPVFPLYIDCGLAWQEAERAAAEAFVAALGRDTVGPLVRLSLPVGDLYGDHWSVSGVGVPDEATGDEAVYLPGRNIVLAAKATVWCGLNRVERLAIATLRGNPFPDATDRFFETFAAAASLAMCHPIEIIRPFDGLSKPDVMRLGTRAPLVLTWSCIAPARHAEHGWVHCGRCNKCGERIRAFGDAAMADPTRYAR